MSDETESKEEKMKKDILEIDVTDKTPEEIEELVATFKALPAIKTVLEIVAEHLLTEEDAAALEQKLKKSGKVKRIPSVYFPLDEYRSKEELVDTAQPWLYSSK